ncbi:MAG: hypothetical protein HC875_32060 [Anaerolineales bacterium]|nr:hypothetical protein [Anaerolineales bacterium]
MTSGGKAPGPDPLKMCLLRITSILDAKQNGDKLSSLEVHDIICFIADAVLAGGIRRAALISLFSADDEKMLSCKTGNWWELNPQRGRANNSAILLRHKITKDFFLDLWKTIEFSNAGEPGFIFLNERDFGKNPCAEILLKPFQMCNLVEINASNLESQEDFENRVKAATIIGTIQASYTDFHYLRPIWKKTTEKEALLGIGMTGIASGEVLKLDTTKGAEVALRENERFAKLLGINKAARLTCVKPAGSTSCVLGTSSGIHAWHSKFYLRRIRVGKNEAIYSYLSENHPEILEDDHFRPHDTAIITLPQRAPEGAITRDESALDLLERVKKVSLEWVIPGSRPGKERHNVSATITIDKHEWKEVGEWMWENRENYSGLSVLPKDYGTYIQPPFEDITEEKYNELFAKLSEVDLDNVIEIEDETDLKGEIACAGGACVLT